LTPGSRLRDLRKRLGLTMRDVQDATTAFASARGNTNFRVPSSRLCEIESGGAVPSIFRAVALAVVYRTDVTTIIALYAPIVQSPVQSVSGTPRQSSTSTQTNVGQVSLSSL
jgi:transcriptional regulator with XRE-family HTH domain